MNSPLPYPAADLALLKSLFACIDNTSLGDTDSIQSVSDFCRRTLAMRIAGVGPVAAVCVYPAYVSLAAKLLGRSGIAVATVAGGFPHGQLSTGLKASEVRRVVELGADEVDIVINRGQFLVSGRQSVVDEVAACKEACGPARLKVILETGQLGSREAIYGASLAAMAGGADYIKTSTGKTPVGATPEAVEAMLEAMRDAPNFDEKRVGIKVAGGVSSPEQALAYARLYLKVMQTETIDNKRFRIGTSRLTPALFEFLSAGSASV